MQTIILGGGCFWCLDATYKLVKGISKIEQGYSGGQLPNPTDKDIYYSDTGHAEVVRLSFDPAIIQLEDILDIFWIIHDPTSLNSQGPDVGPQYRSIIFYNDEDQKKTIIKSLKQAQKLWSNKIVTEVKPQMPFYPAAAYHKDYEANRPDYCQLIINPKLAKLKQKFASLIA